MLHLYDGETEQAPSLAALSGSMTDDGFVTSYTATQNMVLAEFTSDNSVQANGFAFSFTCDVGGHHAGSGPPPPPPSQAITMNRPIQGTVTATNPTNAYTFTAQAGTDYTIDTTLVPVGGQPALHDSVVEIQDATGAQIARNDDGPRIDGGTSNLASHLEWTAPAAGQYTVLVHGFSATQEGGYTLTVASSGTATQGACSARGESLRGHGTISFSADQYTNDATCTWNLQCQLREQVPMVQVTAIDTEACCDFVTLYDGATTSSAQLAHLSGADVPDPNLFQGTSQAMAIQLHTDGSVTHGGFNLEYHCGVPSQGPSTPPGPDTCTPIRAGSRRPSTGEVTAAAPMIYYCLTATAGTTYDITVNLDTLHDSVLFLYGTNRDITTPLAQNDDVQSFGNLAFGERGNLASNLQWTAPAPGTYYIGVQSFGNNGGGTFSLTVDVTGAPPPPGTPPPPPGTADGPCGTGSRLSGDGTVAFSSADCGDRCTCDWTLNCRHGQTPTVTFNAFTTEARFDFVTLYDGRTAEDTQLPNAHFSGSMSGGRPGVPPTAPTTGTNYAATGGQMLIEFTSDASVSTANSFEMHYSCGHGSRPPPPPATQSITPNAGAPTAGNYAGQPVEYRLAATAGTTYQMTVRLDTLSDSVLTLYAADGTTQLATNDDYGDGLASYIEVRAPHNMNMNCPPPRWP